MVIVVVMMSGRGGRLDDDDDDDDDDDEVVVVEDSSLPNSPFLASVSALSSMQHLAAELSQPNSTCRWP